MRHARPLTVGLNCALGAKLMRPYIEELSRVADTYVCAYPNAGLPNPLSETGYDETPEHTAACSSEFAQTGLPQHRRRLLRHDAGAHPRDRRSACATCAPRTVPAIEKRLRLSGLEPLNIGDDSLFVNVGERTNVTGSKAFARLILAGDYAEALAVARQQVENGAQMIDVNMDEAMLDSQAAMTNVPQPRRLRARHRARAGDDRQLEVVGDRGRPEVRAGQVRSSTRSRSRRAKRSSCGRRGSRAATARRWS